MEKKEEEYSVLHNNEMCRPHHTYKGNRAGVIWTSENVLNEVGDIWISTINAALQNETKLSPRFLFN